MIRVIIIILLSSTACANTTFFDDDASFIIINPEEPVTKFIIGSGSVSVTEGIGNLSSNATILIPEEPKKDEKSNTILIMLFVIFLYLVTKIK